MTTTKPSGVLEEAIDAAVKAAVEAHVVPLINGLKAAPSLHSARDEPFERIISMAEMCQRLGCNRTTVMRKMRMGDIPQRRTFPDGNKGWLVSEVDAWLASGRTGEDHQANRDRVQRILKH